MYGPFNQRDRAVKYAIIQLHKKFSPKTQGDIGRGSHALFYNLNKDVDSEEIGRQVFGDWFVEHQRLNADAISAVGR